MERINGLEIDYRDQKTLNEVQGAELDNERTRNQILVERLELREN